MKRVLTAVFIALFVLICSSALAIETYSVGVDKAPIAESVSESGEDLVRVDGSTSITYVTWIDSPDKVVATSVNDRVSLSWEKEPAIDLYSIYEKINGKWQYKTVTSLTHVSFSAEDGEHMYGVSCVWQSSTGAFYESSTVTYVKIVVLDGSDVPPEGADIQEVYLAGTEDQTVYLDVYDNTYLHITTDSLTWFTGKGGAIVTPETINNSVYFTSLGNDLYLNPSKHLDEDSGFILVGTYEYKPTTYQGVSCYTVGENRAYFTIQMTKTERPVPQEHTITVDNNGYGRAWADRVVGTAGTTVTLQAEPDAGYQLKEWQVVSGGVTIQNNQFVMGDADVVINAVFEEAFKAVYHITVADDGNGTGTADPAFGETGTAVTLTAVPHEGYQFREWKVITGGVTVQNNRFTIGNADVSVIAIFDRIPEYTVVVTNDGNGTGSANPVSGKTGTRVTLTAVPNEGYRLKTWKVISGGVSVKNNQFVIGNANVEIKAVFEPIVSGGAKLVLDRKAKTAKVVGPKDKNVKTVTIPATYKENGVTYKITEIAPEAFADCKRLASVSVGKNVRTIGASAFRNCAKLKNVTGMEGVTTIDCYAFENCKALAKITIPAKVGEIRDYAFYNCSKLKSVTIRTTKLNSKNVGLDIFGKNHKKAVYKCPAKKVKAYRKFLVEKGVPKADQIQ